MEADGQVIGQIRQGILKWHDENPRDLPWKNNKDPYHIWISEIILQQTRVAQGKKYYLEFIRQFPTIHHLAESPLEKVLKVWQGLGYYTRAKNLHETAGHLVRSNRGEFPDDYEEILQLKGIGPYTAAAITSFAFDQPKAVVDGNVIRVLTRIFGIEEEIWTSKIISTIQELADRCICPDDPGKFNQAIMDFGALHCRPGKPQCCSCPVQSICVAHVHNKTDKIPNRRKSSDKTTRHFQFFFIRDKRSFILHQREDSDIWPLLYQIPVREFKHSNHEMRERQLNNIFHKLPEYQLVDVSKKYKQILSHQVIYAKFYEILVYPNLKRSNLKTGYLLDEIENLNNFAYPKIIDCYLRDKLIYLKDQS